jgi:hypothetical protein
MYRIKPVVILAVALGLLLGAGTSNAAVITPQSATPSAVAQQSLPTVAPLAARLASPAKGKWYGGIWSGTRKINSMQNMFCIEFPKWRPFTTKGVTKEQTLPGVSQKKSARMIALANKYSSTKSKKKADAAARAIWKLEGSQEYKAWAKRYKGSVKIRKLVKSMLAESRILAIPFIVNVTSDGAVAGASGTATVKVTTVKGAPVPKTKVAFTAVNANLASQSAKTNANGEATVGFTAHSGQVAITASVTKASADEVWMTHPDKDRQRMIGGRFTTSASGTVTFLKQVGAPSINYECGTNCTGIDIPVKVSACNNVTKRTVVYSIIVDGVEVGKLSVPAGTCQETTIKANDAQRITTSSCVTSSSSGSCETPLVPVGTAVEIVCPGWAEATITIACACEQRSSSVAITSPADSTRNYTGFVVVNSRVTEVSLTNDTPAVVDIGALKVGDVVTVGFKVLDLEQPLRSVTVTG